MQQIFGKRTEKQKKVAAIHDLSGFGRCALTVALPVISAMGLQCCPMPTALLSNHTGYPSFSFLELTDQMENFTREWKKLNLTFDGIYSGFLGSSAQIAQVRAFLDAFHAEDSIYLCDPVLGDHGKAYHTCGPDLWAGMRELVLASDLATPNLTELSLMTDTPYNPDLSLEKIAEQVKVLLDGRPVRVVVTGIERGSELQNLIYDGKTGLCDLVVSKKRFESYAGTGDVFASVVAGMMVKEGDFLGAVQKAAAFTEQAVAISHRKEIPTTDGVAFEPLLHTLFV